ncbi:MAG: stage II sporulation protein R [Candidatus Coproplasma sp.]
MCKKLCITFLVIIIIIATVFFVAPYKKSVQNAECEYLRIHVRANSNSEDDQKVKYEVKEEAVKFLTTYITECVTKESAIEVMTSLCDEIACVCDNALKARGFNYGARAQIREEKFPTRVYGELTLEEGFYDALIIELGSGKGDNWWCVIYPPLCFTSANCDVEYRSIIFDIINKFKK